MSCKRCLLIASAAPGTSSATTPDLPPRVFPWFGFVDSECPPVHVFAVQGVDGGLSLLIAAHLDKTKAFGTPRVPVRDHLGRLNCPKLLEHPLQITVRRSIRRLPTYTFFATLGLLQEHSRNTSQAHRGLLPSHDDAVSDLCRKTERKQGLS